MPEEREAILDEELAKALSPKHFVTDGDCMFAKGTKVGEFEITAKLGNSGIGELYLARSVVSRKRFAIKMLPPVASLDPGFEERFSELRAKALSRIHPHIVHIQKMGCHNDEVFDYHYIVMDYIESSLGRPYTLEDLLYDNGRLSEAKTLKIVLQICDALDYAWNAQNGPFIHSDLKPSNALFDTANLVRLTDFDALALLGRSFVKESVKRCVNKSQSEEWAELASIRQDTLRMPAASKKMDSTEAHLLLDSPGKFSLKDLGVSRLVKSEYVRDLLSMLKGEGKIAGDGKPGEKSLKRQGQRGSPTGINAINAVLESYDYMSPEQKAGMELGPQSNVYSLGLIVYRMLTGRKMAGCWDLPSKFGVRKGWDKIVSKCLKMEPEERYSSIAELREDLLTLNSRRIGAGHLLAAAVVVTAASSMAALFWGNGIAEKLSSVFSAKSVAAIDVGQRFPLKMKASPLGAKVKVFLRGQLVASSESLGSEGLELLAERAVYSFVASLPGRPPFSHDFEPAPSLKEIDFKLPASFEEPRSYPKLTAAQHPSPGFPWETPDIKASLIPISAGGFPDASGRSVTKPFWIADRETWQWQYEKIMRSNPSQFRASSQMPVERVSLAKAMEFCKRLTEIEREAGRLPDGYVYRLPTELEWEYCARAGASFKKAFGGEDPKSLKRYVWYAGDSEGSPHPTASLKPNAWGLYDLQGNVWELCADIVKRSNQELPGQSSFVYIAKGGSWSSELEGVDFKARLTIAAIDKAVMEAGFRIVLAPPLESAIVDETGAQPPEDE